MYCPSSTSPWGRKLTGTHHCVAEPFTHLNAARERTPPDRAGTKGLRSAQPGWEAVVPVLRPAPHVRRAEKLRMIRRFRRVVLQSTRVEKKVSVFFMALWRSAWVFSQSLESIKAEIKLNRRCRDAEARKEKVSFSLASTFASSVLRAFCSLFSSLALQRETSFIGRWPWCRAVATLIILSLRVTLSHRIASYDMKEMQ